MVDLDDGDDSIASLAGSAGVDAQHLQLLIDMGFSQSKAIQGLQRHGTVEAAMEMLLAS